jgi:hypothetical protein
MVVKRGVFYCDEELCPAYCKGTFVIAPAPADHYCTACHCRGQLMLEQTTSDGSERPARRVTVEYNYAPKLKRYREAAIVTDEGLDRGAEWIIRSPLIKTEKRALLVAERALANLAAFREPMRHQIVLDMDKPLGEWKAELFDWFKEAAKAFGRYDDPKLVGQSFETITVSEP